MPEGRTLVQMLKGEGEGRDFKMAITVAAGPAGKHADKQIVSFFFFF